MAGIHPQRHWRMTVTLVQDVSPLRRIGGTQALQPPARVVVARLVVALRCGQQLLALAQGIAQHTVHQAFELAVRLPCGGIHCLIHYRVVRRTGMQQLIQRH